MFNALDGVWARVNNCQARYGNQDVKNNYTSVQVGYDRQVSPGVWIGCALSYTDGDNDFRYGDGEQIYMLSPCIIPGSLITASILI